MTLALEHVAVPWLSARPGRRCGATERGQAPPAARGPTSSSTSTLDLREEGTQRLAGPLAPHLQRRYALTRHLRHLLVTQVLHVLEHERFPLIGRQAVQRPPNRLPPGLVLGRVG